MKDKIFGKSQKHFLTDKNDEHGAVAYHVEVERYSEKQKYYLNSTLRLQDCSRPIFIDFGMDHCDDPDEFVGRLAKVDLLIKTLTDMRDDLVKGHEITKEANINIKDDENE